MFVSLVMSMVLKKVSMTEDNDLSNDLDGISNSQVMKTVPIFTEPIYVFLLLINCLYTGYGNQRERGCIHPCRIF